MGNTIKGVLTKNWFIINIVSHEVLSICFKEFYDQIFVKFCSSPTSLNLLRHPQQLQTSYVQKLEIGKVINRTATTPTPLRRGEGLAYSWYVYQTYIIFNFTYCTVWIMVYFLKGVYSTYVQIDAGDAKRDSGIEHVGCNGSDWGNACKMYIFGAFEDGKVEAAAGHVEMRK